MKKPLASLIWLAVALLGVFAYATLALRRGEHLNSAYLLIAALCTYTIGYRFYSKWIAARVLTLNDRRATPCEVHDDGKDFCKTNKWIVFGHHFAAISGPGPLVGPVLAAQFGYLPGTLWILIGVVLGGAVQDFVILFASMRRNGKSLGQMVKEELNTPAGLIALVAILAIMIILLAVLALVVVKALAESPWGVFTVSATIPIAMFMGGYMRFWRVGKVMEASAIGVVLLLLAVWGGKVVHAGFEVSPIVMKPLSAIHSFFSDDSLPTASNELLKLKELSLAWAIILYGLAASVLPVWLLLAPRDYLSTFMKLGTIFALAVGIFCVLPNLQMPALTKFVEGSGLVVAGKLFPFCFITIACGAISGFHTLIASGTTPKLITRESYARPIGYGAMCLESLVAIMAMVAACTMEPGVYFAMNVKGSPDDVTKAVRESGVNWSGEAVIHWSDPKGSSGHSTIVSSGEVPDALRRMRAEGNQTFAINYRETPVNVSHEQMTGLASEVGEHTLYGRTGGAATLAVGMAQIFSKAVNGRWLDLWYHFAIMFEALFILTTLDAGTRVGRYILQDFLSNVWKPLGNTKALGPNLVASGLMVTGWGYFLIQGVRDPLGGINSLWPLFGIANQMLAAIALCLAATIILKMQLQSRVQLAAPKSDGGGSPESRAGRPWLAVIALVPLVWLLAVTFTAGAQKIWHPDPRIGFLAAANVAKANIDEAEELKKPILKPIKPGIPPVDLMKAEAIIAELPKNRALYFNSLLDAFVAGAFLCLVSAIVLLNLREWFMLLLRRKPAILREAEPVWLPDYAVAEGGSKFSGIAGTAALTLALAKELSGEAQLERAQQHATVCECDPAKRDDKTAQKIYLEVTEQRFNGVRRCC